MDPLIEELIEGTTAHFFEDFLQVVRGDDAIAVALDVEADGFLIERLAQLAAQHVKHPGTFWIGPAVKLLHGIAIVAPDHGAPVIA